MYLYYIIYIGDAMHSPFFRERFWNADHSPSHWRNGIWCFLILLAELSRWHLKGAVDVSAFCGICVWRCIFFVPSFFFFFDRMRVHSVVRSVSECLWNATYLSKCGCTFCTLWMSGDISGMPAFLAPSVKSDTAPLWVRHPRDACLEMWCLRR